MSNTPTHSIATSVSQPQTPTPSPIISPSAMLPIYPAIDIDAQVSPRLPSRRGCLELPCFCLLNNAVMANSTGGGGTGFRGLGLLLLESLWSSPGSCNPLSSVLLLNQRGGL